jgi:hypothetical protein
VPEVRREFGPAPKRKRRAKNSVWDRIDALAPEARFAFVRDGALSDEEQVALTSAGAPSAVRGGLLARPVLALGAQLALALEGEDGEDSEVRLALVAREQLHADTQRFLAEFGGLAVQRALVGRKDLIPFVREYLAAYAPMAFAVDVRREQQKKNN